MASATPMLCGSIAGRPSRFGVAMHNAAFRAMGLEAVYVAFETDDTEGAVAAMRALGIRGLGVTTPHKTRIAPFLDEIDETARAIGAVNTVVNEAEQLTGYNVDWIGAVRAFEEALELKSSRAVVLGAGGGARAIVYGLVKAGAKITVFNRSEARGRTMADDLGADFGGPPQALAGAGDYDLLANATTVGFHDATVSLVPAEALKPHTVVFDAVAAPAETRLLREAKARGCRTIPGVRMQLHQAARQFELYTGLTPDLKIMEQAIIDATHAPST